MWIVWCNFFFSPLKIGRGHWKWSHEYLFTVLPRHLQRWRIRTLKNFFIQRTWNCKMTIIFTLNDPINTRGERNPGQRTEVCSEHTWTFLSKPGFIVTLQRFLTSDIVNAWLHVGVWSKLSIEMFWKKPYGFTMCTFIGMNLLAVCDWSLVLILFSCWIFRIALKWACWLNNRCEPFFNKVHFQVLCQ